MVRLNHGSSDQRPENNRADKERARTVHRAQPLKFGSREATHGPGRCQRGSRNAEAWRCGGEPWIAAKKCSRAIGRRNHVGRYPFSRRLATFMED
jgi:hypothetical protein